MANQMSSGDRKDKLKEVFKAIAPTYDALLFLQDTARRLIELANLSAGARVLDVATGTGIIPLLAAERIGANGKIIGIDISEEMLAVAKQKLAAWTAKSPDFAIRQSQETLDSVIEFRIGDAENLDFPDSSFDSVLCASSLFFIPEMSAALKEARRVLKPNGVVGFNSFSPNFLQPLRQLWNERLQKHEIKIGSLPIHRIPDAETCEQLLRDAGFAQIDVKMEQLGYYLPTIADRWNDIAVGLEGMPLLKLPPEQREQIKAEHLAELKALATPKGIWVDVPPIFAFGK